MFRDYLAVLFAVVGLAVGYVATGTTTAILGALFGFFLGKTVYSLTNTVRLE